MDAPPSPNHVFNFPEAEFEEDPQEEPEEEVEEDPEVDPEEGPEEGPEEDLEAKAENDVPPLATSPVGSPITPLPLSESSSDTEDDAPIIKNEALQMPPVGSTYEVGGPSSVTPFPPFHMHGSEIARFDGNTELLLNNVQYLERYEKKRKVVMETCSSEIREGKKRMDKIEEQERDEEMVKVKKHLGTLEANYSLVLSDRDKWRRAFLNLQALVFERLGWGAWDARPGVGNDGPFSFGELKPPKPIMPPKMMKRRAVNKMVKKQIAEAIEEYERTRVDLGNASRSGEANTGGPVTVQVFVNVNRIPWVEFKSMMTTEYCPATEIQRMEEELWTLTLKGDDIEAYNNRFHELVLMCPDMVPNEKKKIKRNQRNEGARGRAYVVVENPQQNPNVVTEKDPKLLSCIKADEVRIEDIRIVCDFPEVYPDDLIGLPPVREIVFRIDLIPVLALPDGPNDFVVYCDASNQGFGCVLMQRGKRRWVELLSDYECEIKYHPGKANVVADALSRKERLKPRRVRAMSMTIQSGLKAKILEAQGEASKDLKAPAEWLRVLERHFEKRDDDRVYFFDWVWIPSVGGIMKLIMDKAHTSRYSVHPIADKMYYDLRDLYWWPGMKRDIAEYVSKCLTNGHDAIWVVMDRLTKSAHFLPIREDYKTDVARHGVPVSIILDRDGRFASHLWQALQKALGTKLNMSIAYHPKTDGQSEHTIQTLEDMLRAYVMDFGGSWDTHLLLVEFSYNNSYHKSIKCEPFEALYGQPSILGSEKINSRPSTYIFSPPPHLQSLVELWGPEFP
nr:putative reverse transcriptase domain-containing protein [Tanacetum cinerariifolium]